MDFKDKLKTLRAEKQITQEELAKLLFVSRAAISKWESGRGYPSIDFLRLLSNIYNISIDELLSSEELINIAENDKNNHVKHIKDVVFGLMDCMVLILLFLPFFGQKNNEIIYEVSLLKLNQMNPNIIILYYIIVLIIPLFGILMLSLQNLENKVWVKYKYLFSIILSAIATFIFMFTLQPYAGFLVFAFLMIKTIIVTMAR